MIYKTLQFISFKKLPQNKVFLFLSILICIFILFQACKDDEITDLPPDDDKEKPDIKAENRKSVGQSANDFLSSDNYDKLVFVVQYMEGYKPEDLTIEKTKEFLNSRLNKSNGIEVILQEIPAKNESSYSTNAIREIEDNYRELYNEDKTLTAYALFINGSSNQDDQNRQILGIAYYNTSVVMFAQTIRNISGGLGQPSRSMVERTVFKHEIGHLLGLVDIGSPMQKDHLGQGGHCDNSQCLMYHTMNNSNVIDILLTGGTVPELDQNCLDDLEANGGK